MTMSRRIAPALHALLACLAVLGVAMSDAGAQPDRLSAPPVTHSLPKPAGAPIPEIACPDCSDGNPCTVDSCDTTTGLCRHDGGTCDDGNPCTTDFCQPFDPPFGCQHLDKANGTACSVAAGCLLAGACQAGACVAPPAPEGSSCDAPSDCTEGDLCDAQGNCNAGRPSSVGTPCDDGDACSRDDACAFDEAGAPVCRGTIRSCDDGDPCTIDSCGADDSCAHTPVPCDDGNRCTADACDSREGVCTHSPTAEGQPCQGPDRCTGSTCVAGNCIATGAPGEICGPDAGCTRAVCNRISPILCSYVPDNSLCSQDGPCDSYYCDTITHLCRGAGSCLEGCAQGQCTTRGFCILTGPAPIGTPCNDGSVCTTNDACGGGGVCAGSALSCDDGDPCTLDRCDPVLGCMHDSGPAACDDANPCTADACAADGSGCLHTPTDGILCDDGDACTTGTTCHAGACAGSPRSCDDANLCTTDSCDPADGCRHAPVTCVEDGNACTRESCDTARGCVSIPLDGAMCGGAESPCVTGTCHANACVLTDRCDDGNDCTLDLCNGVGTACSHVTDLDRPCSDGNPCTTDDACNTGPGGVALCGGTVVARPETCGVGACARTVDTCAGGIPSACLPGAPQPEICNHLDDDCDGQVDENRVMANCVMKPAILYDPSMRATLAFTCRFRDRCAQNAALPPAGIGPGAVWVTRADRLADPNDNVVAPDPLSLACPDPQQGDLYERGLVETTALRVLGGTSVTFNFTTPHDGLCATLDGDRAGLLERLADTPNGLVAVCVAGAYDGSPWEACAFGLLLHRPGSID